MTVADLIAELQDLDEDLPVLFVCDYGDHCHTSQALPVESLGVIGVSHLYDSAYSQSGVALSDNFNGMPADGSEDSNREALILNIPN
jgi:hypothetical protein